MNSTPERLFVLTSLADAEESVQQWARDHGGRFPSRVRANRSQIELWEKEDDGMLNRWDLEYRPLQRRDSLCGIPVERDDLLVSYYLVE